MIAEVIRLTNSKFNKPYDKLSEKEKREKAQLFLQNYIKAMKANKSL